MSALSIRDLDDKVKERRRARPSSARHPATGGRIRLVIVVDTNVVSELMWPSPAPEVREWVRAQASSDLCTTAVTIAEIRYGLERLADGRRKQNLLTAATEIFAASGDYILPFDAGAATWYATIVARRDRLGMPIDGFDAQVTAICRTRTATLATCNTKGLRETGIDVIDPWQQN